jgi:hypothetical protein
MRLTSGAEPIQWAAKHGGPAEMPFVGKVLARLVHNDLHPFVVWSMTSEDGLTWATYQGAYCETLTEAESAFSERRV